MAAPQRHQVTSNPPPVRHPETRPLEDVEALAGAVANAIVPRIMQSISSATHNLLGDSNAGTAERGTDANCDTSTLTTSTGSFNNSQTRQRHQEGQSEHSYRNSASTFELAAGIRQLKRPRVTFEPPSLFESKRRGHHRRGCSGTDGTAGNSRSIRRTTEAVPKATQYSRNVILLPPQYKSSNGEVLIPRKTKRGLLGQAGLVGRVELLSTMTDVEVRREICEVFSAPMGLTSDDLKSDRPFPFSYLQNNGTHSYCVPSVNKMRFEWNGKQVASLAKAGAYIYLIADAELPGYQALVS